MSDVDRYWGLKAGTAGRWIDGYHRGGTGYPLVIRAQSTDDDKDGVSSSRRNC